MTSKPSSALFFEKCMGCDNRAEINLQSVAVIWDITAKGDYTKRKEWADDNVNEFWCVKCAEKQGLI